MFVFHLETGRHVWERCHQASADQVYVSVAGACTCVQRVCKCRLGLWAHVMAGVCRQHVQATCWEHMYMSRVCSSEGQVMGAVRNQDPTSIVELMLAIDVGREAAPAH